MLDLLQVEMPDKQQEQAYHVALGLVEQIDLDLVNGTGHYFTKSGRLLISLEQVVMAILDDDLLTNGSEVK